MSGEMKLYVVCGPPAGGKTRYGRDLAVRVGAVFLDNDIAMEPVVEAGMEAAGLSRDDRDSTRYKNIFRDPVYEAMFQSAEKIFKSLRRAVNIFKWKKSCCEQVLVILRLL